MLDSCQSIVTQCTWILISSTFLRNCPFKTHQVVVAWKKLQSYKIVLCYNVGVVAFKSIFKNQKMPLAYFLPCQYCLDLREVVLHNHAPACSLTCQYCWKSKHAPVFLTMSVLLEFTRNSPSQYMANFVSNIFVLLKD